MNAPAEVAPTVTETERQARTPAYVVRCRRCGALMGACVDDGARPAHTAEWCADQIKAGYTVYSITVGDVWTAPWCHCNLVAMPAGIGQRHS